MRSRRYKPVTIAANSPTAVGLSPVPPNGNVGGAASIARQREQATSRPVGRDVKSRKIGVRALFAVAGQVGVNQTGIPLRNIVILQLQFLTRRMRSVDDQHVRPLDQALQNLPCIGRFQIQSQSTLVAIVQMPLISVFSQRLRKGTLLAILHDSPLGGSTLITSAPKSDKITAAPGPAMKLARSTTFSPEKMLSSVIVVFSVPKSVSFLFGFYFPLKFAGRFCRNACVPSFLSSVPAQIPNNEASSDKPSATLVSNPLFTASSEYFTAIGAFLKI